MDSETQVVCQKEDVVEESVKRAGGTDVVVESVKRARWEKLNKHFVFGDNDCVSIQGQTTPNLM